MRTFIASKAVTHKWFKSPKLDKKIGYNTNHIYHEYYIDLSKVRASDLRHVRGRLVTKVVFTGPWMAPNTVQKNVIEAAKNALMTAAYHGFGSLTFKSA